jgi:hypothetical protein
VDGVNKSPCPVGAGDVTRCFRHRAALRGGSRYGGPWFRYPGSQKTSQLSDVHVAVMLRAPPYIGKHRYSEIHSTQLVGLRRSLVRLTRGFPLNGSEGQVQSQIPALCVRPKYPIAGIPVRGEGNGGAVSICALAKTGCELHRFPVCALRLRLRGRRQQDLGNQASNRSREVASSDPKSPVQDRRAGLRQGRDQRNVATREFRGRVFRDAIPNSAGVHPRREAGRTRYRTTISPKTSTGRDPPHFSAMRPLTGRSQKP